MKIINKALLLAAMAAFALVGCSKPAGETSSTPENTSNNNSSIVAENNKEKTNFNNLTGEYTLSDDAVGKRPVAIMVNNIDVSLPQYGISSADIIFEAPVESGITRLMALYGDYTKIPDICSVRSCRYYYPIFASGYDAVYIHWGMDKTVAKETLERLGIDRLDGSTDKSNLFARDTERQKTYATEHTGYVKGSLIPQTLDELGMRSDISNLLDKPAFEFNKKNKKPSDTDCTTATINFSNSYFSTFSYDENTNTYKKQHNGSNHIDSSNNKQLEFTNVFYLETSTSVINNKNGLISLDWKGGKGYYISNGAIVEIEWYKDSETSPFSFTTVDGKDLSVNAGKSYIGFADKNALSFY